MSRRVSALAAVAGLLLLLCGCGGRNDQQAAVLRHGKTLFASACTRCHTLTGHDTNAPGGDLALSDLSAQDIASFARIMPVRLSRAGIDAVAAYVHSVAAAKR
jgi:mono/diheme cytochrome c family protein